MEVDFWQGVIELSQIHISKFDDSASGFAVGYGFNDRMESVDYKYSGNPNANAKSFG